jgi:hypothetical protein
MTLTVPGLGALFLLLFVLFHAMGIFARGRAVLAFLGAVIVGSTGIAGRVLTDVVTWLQSAFGSVTGAVFGVTLEAGLFIILAIVVIAHLHPKGTGAKRHTGFLALLLGAMVAVGITGIPALAGLHATIVTALGNAVSAIGTL